MSRAMSWYNKPSTRRWQESSEKEWREKGSRKTWNSDSQETWNANDWKASQGSVQGSQSKKDWKSQGSEWSEWSTNAEWRTGQSDWSTEYKSKGEKSGQSQSEWKSSQQQTADWNKTKHDWRSTTPVEKTYPQRHQWVAKEPKAKVVEEKSSAPPIDPAVALESALADVEELLGEKLDSTRELLEDSDRNSREAVSLATSALELLAKKTADCKSEQDLQRVLRAKKSVRELLMWRNFGLKMWLHNKPDPMNFRTYDADVQTELRQTWTKIEQKLMQELVAGDSWSKLARKLRFCVGNKEFSVEMRALLTRIINTCELTQRAKQRRGPVEALSEADRALFAEMATDDQFGNDVINAVRNDRFRHQEAMYPGYAQAGGPAWMQQMLGWQLGAPLPQTMMQPMPSIHPSMPPSMPPPLPPQMPVNPWAEPWPWNSTASSSSGAQ